ncbi:MAG: SDR family oxidoreductase [Geodermatophilaceae bacterium]|nr:SDR family oxidoreductase [Geodermatophilaceae bacterium]
MPSGSAATSGDTAAGDVGRRLHDARPGRRHDPFPHGDRRRAPHGRARVGRILTLSTSAARLSGREQRFHATGGFGVACGAIETFTRVLAGEVGPRGVRVVCLRPDALPETWGLDRPIEETPHGKFMTDGTVLGRMPRLAEVGDTAAPTASDRTSALTRTVVNLSCGSVLD